MNFQKIRSDLDKRFSKVAQTAAGFEFFLAIHDFVGHIESVKYLSKKLTRGKYQYLKEIYQGIEDIKPALTGADLGHARYMAVADLNRLQKKDISENNMFWRKREFFRKTASEIYDGLSANISASEKGKTKL